MLYACLVIYIYILVHSFHFSILQITVEEFPISFELIEEMCSYYERKKIWFLSSCSWKLTAFISFLIISKWWGTSVLLEHFYVSDAFLELHVDFKLVVMSTLSQFLKILHFNILSNCRTFSIQHMSPVNLHPIFFFSSNTCFIGMLLIYFLKLYVHDCIFDTPTSCNIREIKFVFNPVNYYVNIYGRL